MKKILIIFLLMSAFASCKKNKEKEDLPVIIAYATNQGGCTSNTWLVRLEEPDPAIHSFICQGGPTSSLNCTNSVYIQNFPASLMQFNKKIKFSKFKDNGILCSSSTFATHHIEVYDLSAQ